MSERKAWSAEKTSQFTRMWLDPSVSREELALAMRCSVGGARLRAPALGLSASRRSSEAAAAAARRPELARMWGDPGVSMSRIAAALGVSKSTARTAGLAMGLPPRGRFVPPAPEPPPAVPGMSERPPLPVGACLDIAMAGPEWASAACIEARVAA